MIKGDIWSVMFNIIFFCFYILYKNLVNKKNYFKKELGKFLYMVVKLKIY